MNLVYAFKVHRMKQKKKEGNVKLNGAFVVVVDPGLFPGLGGGTNSKLYFPNVKFLMLHDQCLKGDSCEKKTQLSTD